jgi:hypothetical protein
MKTCKSGLHKYPKEHKSCRECKLIRNRAWSEQNKDRKRLNYEKHYEKNKSQINANSRLYYKSNKDKIKQQQKQYNENNKEHLARQDKIYFLKRRYNLTIEELQTLYEKQNHKCAICHQTELDLGRKLNVDHCHKTGKVRGLLCGSCNRALGLLQDRAEICLSAANYLNNLT